MPGQVEWGSAYHGGQLQVFAACHRQQGVARFSLADQLSLQLSQPGPVRGTDARGDCDPRANGNCAAGRLRATDRLFCLRGRLARLRCVWQQPLPVVGRGFDDHADLCRWSCRARGNGLIGLRRARRRTRADGRADAGGRRDFSTGLDRRSLVYSGHDRLSRGDFGAHPDFPAAGSDVQDNAAESVRRVIDRLHDSAFAIETDQGSTIKVRIAVDKKKREATVDFTGTSPQQASNFNAPEPVTRAAVLYVFRVMVDDDIPMNAGAACGRSASSFRKSLMLTPEFPAAVVARQCRDL